MTEADQKVMWDIIQDDKLQEAYPRFKLEDKLKGEEEGNDMNKDYDYFIF